MATDPYAAPRARVADLPAATADGRFIPEGQAVAAGRGWTWFVEAWGQFRRQPGTWILLTVVFLAGSLVIGLIPFLGNIASSILGPVFLGGLMLGCRELARGGELRVGHLFAGFQHQLARLAFLGVVYLLLLIAVILIAFAVAGVGLGSLARLGSGQPGGVNPMSILLAVLIALALFIPVAMAMWFAPALVALNDFAVGDALKASFFASLKNFIPFLVYGAALLGLGIVASIPIMLGWFVLGPMIIASIYTAYRDIFYAE